MNEPPIPEPANPPPDREPATQPAAALISGWDRIKEHKVLQWGLAYLGAALAFAHGGDLLGHAFHWPEALNRLLLGVLIVGFPVALALAWYHGHRSLRTVSTGEATIIALLVVIGAGLLILFVRAPPEEAAPVAARVTPAGEPHAATSKPQTGSGPSIAVLPFVNMSSDHEQDYFSDGLSEELLNELAHIPNLRVIGRTSSFAFKGKNVDLRTIGETLGVDHILEGSVRKSADSLRITAQLINPADGSHLWSATYERKLGDVFTIQEDIARTVASALQLSIEATNLSEGGTLNIEAYDAYLRAASEKTPIAAIPLHERAVELDPRFSQAWAALAQDYDFARVFMPKQSREWLEKSRAAEDRVLALVPKSAAAQAILIDRKFQTGNLVQTGLLFESARAQSAGVSVTSLSHFATFLLGVGRTRDALEILRAAQQADPIAGEPRLMQIIGYESLGDFKQADAVYEHAIAVVSDGDPLVATTILRAMGRRDPAAIRVAIGNTYPNGGAQGTHEPITDPGQINATMATLLDNAPAALEQLRLWSRDDSGVPTEPILLSVLANWAAYFGDPALSLRLMRRMPRDSANARAYLMLSLWRPVERNMRALADFKLFAQELGLADYWRTSGNWGDYCRAIDQGNFECH